MPPLTLHPLHRLALAAGLVLGAALTAPAAHAAEGDAEFSAGFKVQKTARAEDIGLPVFPGSVPRAEKTEDGGEGHGASVGMHWGRLFGLQVHVLKFHSDQPMAAVATHYRDALGRHGPVLDCSPGVPRAPAPADPDSDTLHCGDDAPKPGEVLLKTGTRHQQRVVKLSPAATGPGVDYALVRVAVRKR